MRRGAFLGLVVLLLTVLSRPADADQATVATSLKEVIGALERERAAIADAVRAFEARRAEKSERVEKLRARRDRAKHALRRARAAKAGEPTVARGDEAAAALSDEDRTALRQGMEQLLNAATVGNEQLKLYLAEVPGSDAAIEKITSLLGELEHGSMQERARALQESLTVLDRAHDEGGRVWLGDAEVWTAHGRKESVRLLRVGHAAFAYQAGEGRMGLALSSPAEASGYRWTEELGPEVRERVRAAFASYDGQPAGLLEVPLDVSGQIRTDTQASTLSPARLLAAGGYVMYPLAAVALIALLLIVERAFVFYRLNRAGESLPAAVVDRCRKSEFSDAEALCAKARGAVGRTLHALIRARTRGRNGMEDTVQEQLLHELPRLQRRMGGIAILAAVAPLLGLLGTVTGIIQTFRVVHSFGNANPGLLAGGISEALMTTATGLCIAIPVFLVHSMLRGRLDKILSDAERQAASVLNVIVHEVQP